MGEVLVDNNILPTTLHILCTGQLRQLVDHPDQPGRPLTIAIHSPPFIAGWASIQSGKPLELLTAASECSILSISLENWESLLLRYPS